MKLTTGILAAVMMTGGAWAQNPNIIHTVQNKMTAVEQQQTEDSNAALGIESTPANGAAKKPSPVASAPAVKPAPVQATKPTVSLKPASSATVSASATKRISASNASNKTSSNKLERVKVIRHADDVQIELSTLEAVTPTVDKLSSPDRVVVELPSTAMATEQSKIAVGAAGIKGVRIGVNGKTPPTTSVVVDLEHAVNYEISPGPSEKFVLTLHVQGATEATTKKSPVPAVAKAQPAQKAAVKSVASASTAAPKSAVATASKSATAVNSKMAPAKMAASTAKPVAAKPVTVARMEMPAQAPKAAAKEPKVAISAKTAVVPAAPKVAVPAKIEAHKAPAPAPAPKAEKITIAASKDEPKSETSQASKNAADNKLAPIGATADDSKAPKPEEKKWAMNGKRDPFFSPVVQQATGSGCSTGKKCLEIGQINVRGIVKSEAGFIAVVTNSMNKAYFLHENDPVFNGYVLRITGDSVVFQETYQDNLGKSVTREVTKTVVAPAV
ncbi:MAG TPA: AMIN domain-containing protein [Candidatus Aquilonibacter sp.]|nr:AMIN domain-containing protein [Candidatus Aquilonibacter sp.]